MSHKQEMTEWANLALAVRVASNVTRRELELAEAVEALLKDVRKLETALRESEHQLAHIFDTRIDAIRDALKEN